MEALGGRVRGGGMNRTCLFSNAENANGASATGVFTETMGYRGDVGRRPYGRYRMYESVLGSGIVSIMRVSTTSGGDMSSVERLERDIGCSPAGTGCGMCVVSRMRVLSRNTFGTLLGALRRPPSCMVFVLTAARPRGVPTAVLSEYREFSFGEIAIGSVASEVGGVYGRRGVRMRRGTLGLVTEGSRKTLESTLDVLSRYVSFSSGGVRCGSTMRLLKAIGVRRLFRVTRSVVSRSAGESLRVLGRFIM